MKTLLLGLATCLAVAVGGVVSMFLLILDGIFELMRIARYCIIKGIQLCVKKMRPDVYQCGKWNRLVIKISKNDVDYGSRIYDLKISSN